MMKEIEEALSVLNAYEDTGNDDTLGCVIGIVVGCEYKNPFDLFLLEKIEDRINAIYKSKKISGNVPPVLEGIKAAIDFSKGSYKFLSPETPFPS